MKKTFKILFSALLITAFILPTTVKADSFNFNVTPSKSNLQPEETVELTLNLSDINTDNGLGINTVETKLEYNKDIFEEVKATDVKPLNGWSLTYNDENTENNGKILGMILSGGVKQNQNIGTITLKVKKNVSYTTTTIKFKNVTSNNGTNLIEEGDKPVTLTIGTKPVEPENGGNNSQGGNQQGGSNQGSNNQGGNQQGGSNQGNNKQENVSTGKLPQTGSSSYIIGTSIILLSTVAVFACIRMKKLS